jgi:hemolysin activation/secretion protein
LGIDAFDATTNNTGGPDGEFFAWRGQAQWVKLLAPDTLFIARTDLQLADRPLLPSEQIGLGGQGTVRGYRQDRTLADNGFIASAEFRYPVLRVPQIQGLLQITPFIDFGTAWNTSTAGRDTLNPDTLASVGLGLLWQQSDRLTARFDWGVPLGRVSGEKNSWQENGLYFSIIYNQPF